MANKKTLESYIASATENIVEDRAATKSLLLSLMKFMKSGEEKHREYGTVAAKYLETLQRSNEQLVKIATLIQKKENKSEEISEDDRQKLFDIINEKEEDSQ